MNKRMMYTMDATIVIMLDPIVPLRLSQRHPKIICERRGVSDACFFRRGCSNHEKDDGGGGCIVVVVVVVVQSLAALTL